MTTSMAAARRLYDWDGCGRLRTPLSIALALSAVALGFALSMTVEGILRYGPISLGLVATGVAVANPGHRRTLAALAVPFSFSWLGALIGILFCVSALAAFAALSSGVALVRRGGPWPDIAPGRLRQGVVVIALGCGIVCAALAVDALLGPR